jgi:hypothetical protein
LVIISELGAAKVAYGDGGGGLDPSSGLDADVTGADVFALRGLNSTNFRSTPEP